MAFDPDAYAAEAPTPKAFDPEAYAAPEKPKRLDAAPSHKRGADVMPIKAADLATGPLEGAATIGTSMLAYPAGLAAGAASLALGRGKEPLDFDAAREWRNRTQEALTYAPRTESGQGFVRAVDRLMAPWSRSAEYVGRKVGEASGNPTLGGAAEEVFGAAVNPMAPLMLGKGLRRTARLGAARVAETPEAALLRSQGVEGLTTGQRAGPQSVLGQLESASADNWQGLAPERAAAEQSWRRQVIRQSMKDKAAPLPKETPHALDTAYNAFDAEYGPIESVPVDPAKLSTLPAAAEIPGRGIPDSVRSRAAKVVDEALSTLKDEKGNLPAAPTVGDLQEARTFVRKERTRARANQQPDHAYLDALDHAEGVLSKAMNESLTPEQAAELAAIDKRYATYSTIEKAAPRGKDNFTPGQLLRAAESSSGRRAAKHGRGGTLQQLGQAAEGAFVDAPFTGGRGAVLGAIPFGHKLAAPFSRIANTEAMQRFLFDPRVRYELTGAPEAAPLTLSAAMARAMEARREGLDVPSLRLGMAAAHEQEGQ